MLFLQSIALFYIAFFYAFFTQSNLIYGFFPVILFGFYYALQGKPLKTLNFFNFLIFTFCAIKDFTLAVIVCVFALGVFIAQSPLSSPLIKKLSYTTLSLLLFVLGYSQSQFLQSLQGYKIGIYLLLLLPSLLLWFIKQKSDSLFFGSIVLGIIAGLFAPIPASLMTFYYWGVFFALCVLLILQNGTIWGIALLMIFSILQYILIENDYLPLGLFFGICCIVLFILLRRKNATAQK